MTVCIKYTVLVILGERKILSPFFVGKHLEKLLG